MRTLIASAAAALALAVAGPACRPSEPSPPGQGGAGADPGQIQKGGSGGAVQQAPAMKGETSADPHDDANTQGQGNPSEGFKGPR